MSGNIVIPFKHMYELEISSDGTLAAGTLDYSSYVLYTISYTEDPAAPVAMATPVPTATPAPAEAPLRDGEWNCDCGMVNASKFCPECGAARPWADCGFKPQGIVPKYCPKCGKKY